MNISIAKISTVLCGLCLAATASAAVTFVNKKANGDQPIYVAFSQQGDCRYNGGTVHEVKAAPALPTVVKAEWDMACILASASPQMDKPVKIDNVHTNICTISFKDSLEHFWRGPGCGE